MASVLQFSTEEERHLWRALQPLIAGEKRLPVEAEVEPGAFLWLVQEAWNKGPGRDGRSKHITDDALTKEIASRSKENFDRNRYQAMFGRGKPRKREGPRYKQPIPRGIARAYLDIALRNWERPSDEAKKGAANEIPDATPFGGLSSSAIQKAVSTAVSAMYDGGEEVRCRKLLGMGPRGLYEELGLGGYSLVVIAIDGAVRMDKPHRQVATMADILHSLLCTGAAEAGNAVHVWAFPRHDFRAMARSKPPEAISRQLLHVANLRSIIGTLRDMNALAPPNWRKVPLDRCLVATPAQQGEHPLFKVGPTPADVEDGELVDTIPIFALPPVGPARFFQFFGNPPPGTAYFVELHDLPEGHEALREVVHLAKNARGRAATIHDAWMFCSALEFAKNWQAQVGEEEEA